MSCMKRVFFLFSEMHDFSYKYTILKKNSFCSETFFLGANPQRLRAWPRLLFFFFFFFNVLQSLYLRKQGLLFQAFRRHILSGLKLLFQVLVEDLLFWLRLLFQALVKDFLYWTNTSISVLGRGLLLLGLRLQFQVLVDDYFLWD